METTITPKFVGLVKVGLVGLCRVKAGLSRGLLGGSGQSTVLRGLNIGVPGEAR